MTCVICEKKECKNNKDGECTCGLIGLKRTWYVLENGIDQLRAGCVECEDFQYRN